LGYAVSFIFGLTLTHGWTMPFIDIRGAHIHYESFGIDRSDLAPIVLIHSATITGHADWHVVAPLLATEYRVIVPDCRGHGQSSNPAHSYSFKELAADVAALIRALGYKRAHLIGHSNGGNVALVTLLEHPEAVQTCILQAANAYVTPYLIDREPGIFDPDRIAREAPEWMDQMIALHGPTHGSDYWRELLQLTLREIITEPNYTPEDLVKVARPVFVIQGANDVVNAPDRHAQFIAQHIPDAELWLPAQVAHRVHQEIPLEWLARVLGFLERRGDDANDALYHLRRAQYADTRETIFDVQCSPLPVEEAVGAGDVPAVLGVRGRVLTEEQRQAALDVLPVKPVDDHLKVLLTAETPWALIKRSVSDVRRTRDGLAEQITQVLIGEAVRMLEDRGYWSLVRAERDGYIGWTRTAAVQLRDRKAVRAYQKSANVLVRVGLAPAFERPSRQAEQVGALPFAAALPMIETRRGWAALRLPDDRVWWVKETDLLPLVARPKPNAAGIAFTLDLIKPFVGTPYLWGGRSPYGYDCSGLAQTFWGFMGVSIPRDADQQFRAGKLVKGTPRPGDLLFFGGDDSDLVDTRHQRITHVAISRGGAEMIHANGGSWSIAYNSLNPASPIYRADLQESLVGIRRY
jgi:pimeloyl-ACP methyl ester carboxylesterase/cell wall-associated NlpC family hydrolase